MKHHEDLTLLRRAADRARTRTEFMGWVFARFEQMEGIEDENLRDQLGIVAERWTRLQLCLRPRADVFLNDVTQIATEFHIDRAVLAAIVRRVDALEVIQARKQPGSAGSLLAARTRKRPKRTPGSETEASSDE